MISPEEREQAFRDALSKLLEEHGAEMKITDDGKPWGRHSGVVEIYMPTVWENDIVVKEYTEFNL